MRSYDLTPLMRSSVGFDRFDSLFNQMYNTASRESSFPPYDIARHGENDYRITMALAGYDLADIQIVLEAGVLTISAGSHDDAPETDQHYLHRGIARRAFEKKFNLDDTIRVNGAQFENGLLVIELEREVPDRMRPRQIAINASDAAAKPLHASAA